MYSKINSNLKIFVSALKNKPATTSVAILLLLYFPWIWVRGLQNPDETRYGSIVLEMLSRKDFILPHLNGLPYLEKPPLLYWLGALSVYLFGPLEGILRIWPLISGAALAGLTARMATVIFDVKAGFYAGIIASSSIFILIFSQVFTLDLVVATFICAALASFLFSITSKDHQFRNKLLFYFFCGFAVLAKGLIGIVLPVLVILAWSILARRLVLMRIFIWIPGIFAFLAITMPWHILLELKQPGSLNFYIVHEHLQRYTSTIHNRFRGWWFIPLTYFLGMMPWTGYAGIALKKAWCRCKEKSSEAIYYLFFLTWIGVIFLFFLASQSHLAGYLLPLVAPTSVITGKLMAESRSQYEEVIGIFLPTTAFILVAIVSAGMCLNIPYFRIEFLASLGQWLWLLTITSVITAIGFIFFYCKKNFGFKSLCACIFPLLIAISILSSVGQYKSIRGMLLTHLAEIKEYPVYSYGDYILDATFYLNRPTIMVDHNGELRFGNQLSPRPDLIVTKSEMIEKISNNEIIFVITRDNNSKELALLKVIARKGSIVLLSNAELK